MKRDIEVFILKILEFVFPKPVFDRIIIGWRRRVHKVIGYYPEAVFFSKRKSDKKYCIVRYARPTFDLLAAGVQYLFCYYQLAERGYIPILDIEYKHSFRQGRIGEYNIWDECFEQPISAKEASTQQYVLATGYLFAYADDPHICLDLNGDSEDHFIHVRKDDFRNYYAKANEYVRPIWKVRKDLLAELDEEIWNKVRGHKVLGVFLRENFSKDISYKEKADEEVYSHHPLLPGVSEIIEIVKRQLDVWEFDYIFFFYNVYRFRRTIPTGIWRESYLHSARKNKDDRCSGN